MVKITWPTPTNSRHGSIVFTDGVAEVDSLTVWQRAFFTQVGARIEETTPMPRFFTQDEEAPGEPLPDED